MLSEHGLEKPCDECDGGKRPRKPGIWPSAMSLGEEFCPKCSGTGLVPSQAGRALLDFIVKYIGQVSCSTAIGIKRPFDERR